MRFDGQFGKKCDEWLPAFAMLENQARVALVQGSYTIPKIRVILGLFLRQIRNPAMWLAFHRVVGESLLRVSLKRDT
jgi:hypothetical protein